MVYRDNIGNQKGSPRIHRIIGILHSKTDGRTLRWQSKGGDQRRQSAAPVTGCHAVEMNQRLIESQTL